METGSSETRAMYELSRPNISCRVSGVNTPETRHGLRRKIAFAGRGVARRTMCAAACRANVEFRGKVMTNSVFPSGALRAYSICAPRIAADRPPLIEVPVPAGADGTRPP